MLYIRLFVLYVRVFVLYVRHAAELTGAELSGLVGRAALLKAAGVLVAHRAAHLTAANARQLTVAALVVGVQHPATCKQTVNN